MEYDCSNVEYLFMKMVDRDEHNIQTISEGPLEWLVLLMELFFVGGIRNFILVVFCFGTD